MSARRTWRRPWHRLCRNERSGCNQPDAHCFLHMDAYQAIGIALASDVLASAVSAYTYGKNKNLDIKNGLVMMFTVMIFTFCKLSGKLYPKHDHGRFFHIYDNVTRY